MRMRTRILLSSAVIAVGSLIFASTVSAAVELRGRILPTAGGGTKSGTIKVTIKSFSTPEETEKIKGLLAKGDSAAVNKALKSMDKAMLQIHHRRGNEYQIRSGCRNPDG